MKGKRDIAARALCRAGAIGLASRVRARLTRSVTILAYHRVLDVPVEDDFPFDIELVSATVRDFAAQMAYVREHYRPATFETVIAHLDRGEQPPRGTVIVTFDDGFADNYENAFPVLRSLGMPATIFLATGYLDRGDTYWYERLAHAVMTTRAREVAAPGREPLSLDGPGARRRAIARLLDGVKTVPDGVRRETLAHLEAQLAPPQDCRADPRSGPLTWDQVREMSRGGIEFGSHSVDHPILTMVDPDTLTHELVASKARIESETGRKAQVIAYPVGGTSAFNDTVKAGARSAGYRLGVSYLTGAESPESWDPYALRRLRIERYTGFDRFRAALAIPSAFA